MNRRTFEFQVESAMAGTSLTEGDDRVLEKRQVDSRRPPFSLEAKVIVIGVIPPHCTLEVYPC